MERSPDGLHIRGRNLAKSQTEEPPVNGRQLKYQRNRCMAQTIGLISSIGRGIVEHFPRGSGHRLPLRQFPRQFRGDGRIGQRYQKNTVAGLDDADRGVFVKPVTLSQLVRQPDSSARLHTQIWHRIDGKDRSLGDQRQEIFFCPTGAPPNPFMTRGLKITPDDPKKPGIIPFTRSI